jgi:DNA-binding phage protein
MTAAQLAELAALTDEEMTAIAYLEAFGGDHDKALIAVVEDLIACEARLSEVQRHVSRGFVRAPPVVRA